MHAIRTTIARIWAAPETSRRTEKPHRPRSPEHHRCRHVRTVRGGSRSTYVRRCPSSCRCATNPNASGRPFVRSSRCWRSIAMSSSSCSTRRRRTTRFGSALRRRSSTAEASFERASSSRAARAMHRDRGRGGGARRRADRRRRPRRRSRSVRRGAGAGGDGGTGHRQPQRLRVAPHRRAAEPIPRGSALQPRRSCADPSRRPGYPMRVQGVSPIPSFRLLGVWSPRGGASTSSSSRMPVAPASMSSRFPWSMALRPREQAPAHGRCSVGRAGPRRAAQALRPRPGRYRAGRELEFRAPVTRPP